MCPRVRSFGDPVADTITAYAVYKLQTAMARKLISTTISFRASEDLARLIDRERASFDLSRGTYVRGVISAQLLATQEEQHAALLEELHQQLEALSSQLSRVRREQRKSLFVLLTRLGELSGDDAKRLLQSIFQPDDRP